MSGVSIADQIACVKRELKMRRQMYPVWVRQRRMHPDQSAIEIRNMEAVLATLERLAPPAPQGEMFGPGLPR